MKENWMEKLIELLNEYEKYISKWWLADLREFDWTLNYYSNYEDAYVFENVYYRIISNGYGFIKRLVENNKIDRDKIIEKSDFMPIVSNKVWDFLQPTEEQELLMLLSIQDNPIEFLISILK